MGSKTATQTMRGFLDPTAISRNVKEKMLRDPALNLSFDSSRMTSVDDYCIIADIVVKEIVDAINLNKVIQRIAEGGRITPITFSGGS